MITHEPNIRKGVACIRDTTVPVWGIIHYSRMYHLSDAELVDDDPRIALEDVRECKAYYAAHREEVDKEIQIEIDEMFAGVLRSEHTYMGLE